MTPAPRPLRNDPTGARLAAAWLWVPVVLYCALIFGLSSISNVPALPGGMSDKVAHTLLYTGLGFFLARAFAGGLGRPLPGWVGLLVVLAGTLYGLSDEAHQLFVPHRQFDLHDLAADMTGVALGAAVVWLWGIISTTPGASSR